MAVYWPHRLRWKTVFSVAVEELSSLAYERRMNAHQKFSAELLADKAKTDAAWHVVALYAFTPISDPELLKTELLAFGKANGLCGTLILASEGFNGTLASMDRLALDQIIALLSKHLANGRKAEIKFSSAEDKPFQRLKIKIKREIVTLGVAGVDPSTQAGTYVKPQDWNALISDPDTVVIDTRNIYEVAVGTFQNALNPQTQVFRQFPKWVDDNRAKLEGKRIAMFCTGGIRCEKSTALLKAQGFDNVHHLEGGILRYLADVSPEQSLWQGECFVFDERVALAHGLTEGETSLCAECGTPITQSALDNAAQRCPDCVRAPLRLARATPFAVKG
jgi:UPF0176 protein